MSRSSVLRIMLVEDHVSIRAGLRLLLESRDNFKIVGEAGNKTEARLVFDREKPDLILLDLDLRGESGLELIEEFTSNGARVLVLTGIVEEDQHQLCLRLGAKGLVRKEQTDTV